MTKSPSKPLFEVLTPAQRSEVPVPGTLYRQIGVRLWGEGAYERESLDGSQTKYAELFRAESDDVIVNKIWARNGSVAVVPEDLAGCYASAEFPMFRVNRSLLEPSWIHWLSKTPTFWAQCDQKSQGTSGKNRIRSEEFLRIEIPLPPLPEQRRVTGRIADLFAQVRTARSLRHDSAKEIEQAVSCETTRVFDGIRAAKVPIHSLGPAGSNPVQTGPFGAQLHSSEFVAEGIPVLNVGNVWPDGLRLTNLDHVTEEKALQLRRYSLSVGDLLFARSGATLGKVCLVPDGCEGWLMTGHLFRVRFDEQRVFNRFAFAALRGARSIQEQVFGRVRGATRPGYNTTLLGKVELPVPSLSDQRKIVSELDVLQGHVDKLKAVQAETSVELDAIIPSILDCAFKGQL